MATAPDRVDPVFGDALAGNGGMTEPVVPGPRREMSFDLFPDALSALPLPALTWVVPPTAGSAEPAPAAAVASVAAATPRPAAVFRPAPAARPAAAFGPPGAVPAAFGPPGAVPAAGPARPVRQGNGPLGLLAPPSGSRPIAGVGYVPPAGPVPSGVAGVVRPPAYLPQNPGWSQMRAALQQARGAAGPAGAAPRSRPTGAAPARSRPPAPRGKRSSSAWSLIVFAVIVLVSTGLGQRIIEAVTALWNHR